MPRLLLAFCLVLCIAGCDGGQPGSLPQADYEGALGVAIVRHLIKNQPDPAPGIPKSYCLVTGKSLDTTSMDFARRFADLKLRIISADVLLVTPPDNAVVDPETRLAPIVFQIALIKSTGPSSWTADVGWSYKKTFEKQRLDVVQKDGKYEVLKTTRLEGNWQPGVDAKASLPVKP